MIVLNNFTFHDEADAAGNGAVLKNTDGESLTIGVSGTFTGSITVQGKQSGEWFDLNVVDLKAIENKEAITAAGAYAVVSVAGFEAFRCKLTAISAGSVTVTGRLCTE